MLTLIGVYLAGVKVYDQTDEAIKDKPLYAFLVDLSYKRRIFEVLLDVVLVILSYWCAYAIKFGPFSNSPAWQLFITHFACAGVREDVGVFGDGCLSRTVALHQR